MGTMDRPVLEQFDRIPPNIDERMNEFDVKIGIGPDDKKSLNGWFGNT